MLQMRDAGGVRRAPCSPIFPETPPYFARMKRVNRRRRPLLGLFDRRADAAVASGRRRRPRSPPTAR